MGFRIFSNIGHITEDPAIFGLDTINTYWEHEFFAGDSRTSPDLETTRTLAAKIYPNLPMCQDIECWRVKNKWGVLNTDDIDKFISVHNAIREVNPYLKFGFFEQLPVWNISWTDNYAVLTGRGARYDEWVAQNADPRIVALANTVDYIFPDLYWVPSYTLDGWKAYAIESVKMAKSFGKPVYPYICPHYADKSGVLSGDIWREVIKTLAQIADGCVIWDGSTWDTWETAKGMDWWKETKAFLGNIRRTPTYLSAYYVKEGADTLFRKAAASSLASGNSVCVLTDDGTGRSVWNGMLPLWRIGTLSNTGALLGVGMAEVRSKYPEVAAKMRLHTFAGYDLETGELK